MKVYPNIAQFIESIPVNTLSDEQKQRLIPLRDFIQERLNHNTIVRLNFICTHNSRRSHLAQVWAQTFATYYSMTNVFCYSGGTEVTALYPMIVQTLEDTGFTIQKLSHDNNPVYAIKSGENNHPMLAFSKTYNNYFNPSENFAAVMTCTQADEGCPTVMGALQKIAIPFEDPKKFDGTPRQKEKYQEANLQIATALHFVFSSLQKI